MVSSWPLPMHYDLLCISQPNTASFKPIPIGNEMHRQSVNHGITDSGARFRLRNRAARMPPRGGGSRNAGTAISVGQFGSARR